ncbi:MAG: hypothetical protein ACJAZY_003787 [Spirosomataceae bacterium]|jgi:hypothetical protein
MGLQEPANHIYYQKIAPTVLNFYSKQGGVRNQLSFIEMTLSDNFSY